MQAIYIKRIYEEASETDVYRILTDRLWPRGISKELAKLDEWNKNLAPSTELRKWYNHEETRFEEFASRYTANLLEVHLEELLRVKEISYKKPVCLLYASKDSKRNPAYLIKELIDNLE